MAYVYRHPRLAPFAWGTHGWFLFNSMLTTVFTPFVLLELELTAFQLGIALAAAGGAGLLGSLAAARIGRAWAPAARSSPAAP
uniref:MFS transporter n=1 Tax=Phenylobacterium glaciei TaxID=2803784 RepID=A0A974S808_9CAUL|nr:hypothetical protein JKL49_19015 [Phenylobacterium glaciei]